MDEIFEQLIECDKGKGMVKLLQGLAMVLVVLSAFFLLSSLVIAIVMLLLAVGSFILSYLCYVEYEYELYNKSITITKIYNESKRKVVANISMEDVRKVYESNNNTNNKNKVSYYNSKVNGLSIFTFEMNDNRIIELALNEKLKRRISTVFALKIVRQF
ncbi:hypothetical protein [Clostridium sp. 1001271B_151109_B4]|uniref:hypothetical protein n=1 Tax=Clostridium sp. 1001271B_151109_B4 TaxID=2787148 RepID=UPI0018AA98A0|nr:hypothetical protein [Clostridium sp. 1001271B_151109_B4]